jgi:hypothetical protein
MENCTLYSHYLAFDQLVATIKKMLPHAKIEIANQGENRILVITVKSGFLRKKKVLKVNYRERQYPSYQLAETPCELTKNLAGMVQFIRSIPAQNEGVRDKFLQKVMSTNSEIAFTASPLFTNEFEAVLKKMTSELDAFIFTSPNPLFNQSETQYFADKNFDLILDQEGNCRIESLDVIIESKYYDKPIEYQNEEQLARKEASERWLTAQGVHINPNLPSVVSEEEVSLRSVDEIVNRVYALLVTAGKGDKVPPEQLEEIIKAKQITELTPQERYIQSTKELSDQERAYATWRYESLYVLLWALEKTDDLIYPKDICPVQQLIEQILKPSRSEFEATANLKPTKVILDQLDRVYRMNWACVEARLKGEAPSGNINPSIIYERHYALNWLTHHENRNWDDVQTNT